MTEPQIDIEKLDIEQRLRLIERLWDSLSGDPQALPLTAEQEAELDRRLDEMESGDTEGIPWEEVMKRIRARLD
ncbi:MAG: addiction module protein [Gammaproteobacteria bacterium]|nr:addiction module protein [Gammaproteobacteria bacterium]